MRQYNDFFILTPNYFSSNNLLDQPLKNFYVASAYKPYMAINQYLDYVSPIIMQQIIASGVRFIYVNVYNSNLETDPLPVISNGIEKGNWKLTLNVMQFEEFCKTLGQTAFNPGYCNNHNDPFFLALNLQVNNNILCLNSLTEILYKNLKQYLLPPEFSHQKQDLASTPIKKLMRKIVLLTSDGYQNSLLEELVNGSWNNEDHIKLVQYCSLDPKVASIDTIKLSKQNVIEYNKKGLTIVTPNPNDFFTNNYDPDYFFNSGCQFICFNYQKDSGKYTSDYLKMFKENSFVLKPENLR